MNKLEKSARDDSWAIAQADLGTNGPRRTSAVDADSLVKQKVRVPRQAADADTTDGVGRTQLHHHHTSRYQAYMLEDVTSVTSVQ